MKKHIQFRRWIIWGLAVSFYFYEYFIRVAPSVMVEDLFSSFHIGASVFGIISAAYLYAYAPMQLPIGVLMDRYGARKLLTIATLACGVASLRNSTKGLGHYRCKDHYGGRVCLCLYWDDLLTLRKRSGFLQISKFLKCHLVRPDD